MIIKTPSSNDLEQLLLDYNITRSELAKLSGYTYNTLCLIMRDSPGYTFCPVRFAIIKHLLSGADEYLQDTIETFMYVKKMNGAIELYNCLA